MDDAPQPRRIERLVQRARSVNRNPALVDGARRVRERTVGGEQAMDRLATARGRPSDVELGPSRRLDVMLRRAGFGATRDQLETAVAQGYEATVEQLLHPEAAPPLED